MISEHCWRDRLEDVKLARKFVDMDLPFSLEISHPANSHEVLFAMIATSRLDQMIKVDHSLKGAKESINKGTAAGEQRTVKLKNSRFFLLGSIGGDDF